MLAVIDASALPYAALGSAQTPAHSGRALPLDLPPLRGAAKWIRCVAESLPLYCRL
jgi:hypothetical protein